MNWFELFLCAEGCDSHLVGSHPANAPMVPSYHGSTMVQYRSRSSYSSRSARPTSADKLHSAGFIGSPLRMPLRESPGLVLCAIFTLRFEAPYILPWVAHHRRLGVDRLLLYHDDASGMCLHRCVATDSSRSQQFTGLQ